MKTLLTFALVTMVVGAPVVASAQVPTPKDMAACNKKAQEELERGSASPRTDRATKRAEIAADEKARETRSDDSQIQGIDRERAKDPAYVAEYRKCMRQNGF
jgi:hypothetical protein